LDLSINGQIRTLNDSAIEPSMPLLWALRDVLDLTGTKFGCGVAACGACTVHVDGQAARSCVTPLASIGGKRVVTIEALGSPDKPHALQIAWLEHQVPQCGYCQSGMLMAAAALLAKNANPSDADIDAGITNICRCGTYPRIRMAIKSAAAAMRAAAGNPPSRARPKPPSAASTPPAGRDSTPPAAREAPP
jgi:isoquinoline 1-oxidoreductase subunit alpha